MKLLADLERKWQARINRAGAIHTTRSYSQCGEDRIVAFLFHYMSIWKPTYLDLGANDPVFFSNTYLFYRCGFRGVCVEAEPTMYQRFASKRPGDICLNAAIAPQAGPPATLHVFESSASGLNTLSPDWAQHGRETGGHQLRSEISVPTLGINELLEQHFPTAPNFLSIDIEGSDLPVLKAIDLRSCRPDVICVETYLPMSPETGCRDIAIGEYLVSKGYRVFADTFINTIYVPDERFPSLQ